MAGYYDEEEYTGPHRATAPQFDTMNMGPGPHRVGAAAQFDTMNLGAGPHRVGAPPQFDTMNLGAPVRVVQDQPPLNSKAPPAGDARNPSYYTDGSGLTPMNPALEVQSSAAGGGGGRMHNGLVIASLCLRAAAVLSLIISLAVLASDSETLIDGSVLSFASSSSTKYALAAAIIGAVYSIYETVSAAVRLAMGYLLLPGDFSLFVSYIGDQVVIVLILTGASAAAATFKDLHDSQTDGISSCDLLGNFCKQGAGAIAMMFLGFCFLAASLVISSFCFYKRKT